MDVIDISKMTKAEQDEKRSDHIGDTLRDQTVEYSKMFKTSWLKLGQNLYSIHRDKLFHGWGFNKFDDYAENEVGIKKSICMKILKAYLFAEEDEPQYLKDDFSFDNEAPNVPDYEALDFLRRTKTKKGVTKDDYAKVRELVFQKGKGAGAARKELTAMMREREEVDSDEARDQRSEKSIKKVLNALDSFSKDMESLKVIPQDIIEKAEELMNRLKVHI